MESQISPKAEVAELELEAVIGFNGEASSMYALGGFGTPGTCSANRHSETPAGTWKAVRYLGMSPGRGPITRGPDSPSCPEALESHFPAPSIKKWPGFCHQ